jgi:hypothetical protein
VRRDTHARSASSPDLTGLGLSKNPFGKASGTSDAFLASLVERNVADMRRYLASGTVLGIASADDDNLRVAFVESCLDSCEKPSRVFAISGSKLHQAANQDLLRSTRKHRIRIAGA